MLSIEEEHTRIVVAAALPYRRWFDGGSLLKFADRHFITDGRPTTTGSGKLYLKKDIIKKAYFFLLSFKFVWPKSG